ncbi:MAG TPA: CBS domain-containing protein [Myxococcaceae bacterium]|nr:CBS domain-containing protein [Myxococcaceae bacterium]
MRCDEVMKRDVVSVTPDDSVQEAAQLMREENIGFIPVCDQDNKVIGTITDRDIAIRLVASNKSASTSVRDIMSHELVAVRPADDLSEAERQMVTHHKSRIVCTDDMGRLEGVISLSDIAQAEGRSLTGQVLREVTEREATPGPY